MIAVIIPVFRKAAETDIGAIVALIQSAYRGQFSRQGWTTEADLLDGQRTDAADVARSLAAPDSAVLLASIDGELLACCHVERHGDAAYFGMFAVHPPRQGGGLGRLVLAEAERHARQAWQCSAMHMKVIDVRSDLMAWYERQGYRRTGECSPFPYGDERFGIPRRDDLKFELMVKDLTA
ncbi:GNAT family N-acetyltransferase [Dyella choica]|uniref:GNAT family N-acetyltransferase n=1 Tax=Dyella choica TaxID=1927959 RepID=A0A3S0RJP6_9GAMM|nr:GNAT family N-acetyltransferase [Dyella choica]RUL74018.1 GNAT family N-acetyltransferase [Dyella choica]